MIDSIKKITCIAFLTLLGINWISHAAAFGIGISLIIDYPPGQNTAGFIVDWIKVDIVNSALIVLSSSYGGTRIIKKWLDGHDNNYLQPSIRKKVVLFIAFFINLVEVCWGSYILAKLEEEKIEALKIYFILMFAAAVFKTIFCFIASNWILFYCTILNKNKNELLSV